MKGLLRTLGLLVLLVALRPWTAAACAICYGEPDSPASKGLTWAIVVLGVIVVGVLAGAVSFFVQASRKAALMPAPPTSEGHASATES